MKFAFPSGAAPAWDPATLAARARELGFDGVELDGTMARTRQEALKEALAGAGLAVSAISCPAAWSGDRGRDRRSADEVRRIADAAPGLGAAMVKMLDAVPQRMPPQQVVPTMAEWLAPLVEHAALRGVQLTVTNALSLRLSRDMWLLMEQLNDPAVGVCWDALPAALAGELPAISIPLISPRIRYVQVRDAALKASPARLCPLGEGDLPLADLFRQLQGVGYRGWVSAMSDPSSSGAEVTEQLAQALARLRQWTQPPAAAPAPAKKAAAVGG
jgi:sugar phosphate isomerase/epimerase